MLIAWATLHSLEKVRRNISSRPELLTLLWKSESNPPKPWTLNLLITDDRHEACVSHIVKQMQNLGVGIEKVTKNQTKIKESEVTKEAIAQMDIE